MLHIFFDCIIIHTDSRFVLNNVLINTKTQILETAKSLFLEFGFENTSMLQITKRANVSKGGFYHYFACKEDLLHAILDNYVDHLYIQAKEIFEDPNMDPIEKIRLWVKTQNAFVQPKEAMFQKAFCNENFITLRYCLLKKIRQGIYPLLESNIRIWVKGGYFHVDDPEITMQFLFGMLESYLFVAASLNNNHKLMDPKYNEVYQKIFEKVLNLQTWTLSS